MGDQECKSRETTSERTEPELLYHYTTQSGLLGILRDQCIWASHVRYLNDASEFKHGLELVSQSLSRITIDSSALKFRAMELNTPFPVAKLEEMLRASADETLKILDFIDVFVASFFDSEGAKNDAGDVLEQWRAYSGNGAGISIGFDKKLLSDHLARIGSGPESWIAYGPCHYRKDKQEKYLADRVGRIGPIFVDWMNGIAIGLFEKTYSKPLERFKSGSEDVSEDGYRRAFRQAMDESNEYLKQQAEICNANIMSILNELLGLTVFMKHPSFEQENEWRLARFLFGGYGNVKFREGTSSLIPYVCIPLPLMGSGCGLIRRIVVGPSPKLADSIGAVKMLIQSYGLKPKSRNQPTGIDVMPSNIPHRSW